MNNLLLVIFALFLVALNGFYVAAEFSIVTLRRTRVRAIAKTQGLRGRILSKVHSQLDAYLSACQLGITLASLGLGWIGEPAFARLIEGWLHVAPGAREGLAHTASLTAAFLLITFLHIILGEQAPKSIAIQRAEQTT